MSVKFPRFGRTVTVLLCVAITLGIVVALFDWNWFRHPLERYLVERSHREVRIGDLHVKLGFSLEPTVRLRDVYIENAPWADKRPFLTAREASFTFSLKSVWDKQPVISRLVLIDADLDMERQADGLRNWRLKNPDDRGPGRVKVQRLEPHGAKIRFARRDIELDLTASSRPSESGSEKFKPDAAHPTRIDIKGEFAGTAFSGTVLTSEVLTFLDTGESFSMRGHAIAGKSRLDVDGSIADLFRPSAFDAKVHLAGHSLANLDSFFRGAMPPSRPYDIAVHVRQTKEMTTFAELRGKVGTTDLAGNVSIDRGKERTTVKVALRSESADLADLRSLLGRRKPADKATGKVAAKVAVDDRIAPAADDMSDKSRLPKRLFSDHEFDATSLQKLDAHAALDFKKLTSAQWPALESLHATADLNDGVLVLKPVDVGMAGGHVVGQFRFDARQKALSAHATIALKEVRLEQLVPSVSNKPKGAGALQGRVNLRGQGNSIAAIAASATGPAEIDMSSGAISNLLDAEIGLNPVKVLKMRLIGDRPIGINSATIAFEFDHGLGKSKTLMLDTDQTHTEGTGTVNLRDETLDVLLTPHPKKNAVFALRSSIRLQGSIRKPKITLAKKQD